MSHREADSGPADYPDVWSGGQVCAFSGLDGPTRWATAVGARTLADRAGVAFDTEPALCLTLLLRLGDRCLELPVAGRPCRLAADGLAVEVPLAEGRLTARLAFVASDTLRGELNWRPEAEEPAVGLGLRLTGEGPLTASATGLEQAERRLTVALQPPARVLLAASETELAAGQTEPGEIRVAAYLAEGRATPAEPLTVTFTILFGEVDDDPVALDGQPDWPASRPELTGPETDGLTPALRRCRDRAIQVLRANAFAAEGNLPRPWIVTQRFKHRNFNTFHAPFLAVGALHFEPRLAVDLLRCALAQQQPNGHIPEQAWPLGQTLDTPPPLLAWGFWQVYRALGEPVILEEALSRLKDYIKYPLAARLLERMGHARSGGAKFLSWGRGEGSNMDNSPRFDINEPFAAVDLTSFAAAELDLIARMIEELSPEHREAVHLGWLSEELGRETQEYFWDPAQAFFCDRYPDGDPVAARTLAGLAPLFCGVATAEQAALLVERHVQRPDGFWTPCPLASLTADDPRYDNNMWRGGCWPGWNLMIVAGLRRYGFTDLAEELRARTVEEISRWYRRTGVLWEYFDSTGKRSPEALPRGRRIGALPDYGWTAAAFLALLYGSGCDL